MQRHGYKGAFEMAATVDYLFGYDATAQVVDDWMYERVHRAYLLDEALQHFLQEKNPWALRVDGRAPAGGRRARPVGAARGRDARTRLRQIYLDAGSASSKSGAAGPCDGARQRRPASSRSPRSSARSG